MLVKGAPGCWLWQTLNQMYITASPEKLNSMVTPSDGNIFCVTGPFSVTGPLCREFTSHRWIPLTEASHVELWCLFYLCPNKWLSKQSRHWWFGTPLHSLWHHCIVIEANWCIYVSVKKYIIGSDNGWLSVWYQAIIWAIAGSLLIRILVTNFSKMWLLCPWITWPIFCKHFDCTNSNAFTTRKLFNF